MECNKDEATRAKEIAEKKFAEKDIPGAKKFALKAQNLYPGLEGLPQMLATFDVYISSENKVMGELDWYGILGANPGSDEDTMKKQYRKLALMLHPDKNKSVGADGAFKMISEAWGVLGDKSRRNEYDQKRFVKTSQQKVPPGGGGPAAPPGANGFHNFNNIPSAKVGVKNAARAANSAAASKQTKPGTFWTACHRCKMQYEYLRIYQDHNLLCPNCQEPFLAKETPAPASNGSNWTASQRQQIPSQRTSTKSTPPVGLPGHTAFNQTGFQWGPFQNTANTGAATVSPSTAQHSPSVAQHPPSTAQHSPSAAKIFVEQTYEKVKRDREEAQAAAAKRQEAIRKKNLKRQASKLSPGVSNIGASTDPKGERPTKRRNVNEGGRANVGINVPNRMATGNGVHSAPDRANASFFTMKPNSTRDLSQIELRNMLEEKAKREIKRHLFEVSAAKAAEKEKEKGKGKDKENNVEKQTVTAKTESSDQRKSVEAIDTNKTVQDKTEPLDTTNDELNTEVREPLSITVPDPDFHDFDRDRSERSFGENQVWAAYDDDDGMPRYYALIHRVISLNPFKMKISWLNSKTNSEIGPLNWVGSGFAKTCGDFRVGKYEINNSLNSFSHRVKWTKGIRGAVRIFPKKGDVWALYRNWSPDWNELTPDEVIHKYDMMEVIEDYNEEQGVFVTPLVKVAGFKTVFHRHLDPKQVKRIPKEELFQFSHQVPSYLLTGSEAKNAPKGCRELDPAATPLELLQVITEVKEDEIPEPAGEGTIPKAEEQIETKGKRKDENSETKNDNPESQGRRSQ